MRRLVAMTLAVCCTAITQYGCVMGGGLSQRMATESERAATAHAPDAVILINGLS